MNIAVFSTADSNKSHCRFCAKEKVCTELLFLSEKHNEWREFQTFMKSIKMNSIDLSIQSKLPMALCVGCHTMMKNFCEFLNSIIKAQDILYNIYNQAKHITVLEDIKLDIYSESPEITESIKCEPHDSVLNEDLDVYEDTQPNIVDNDIKKEYIDKLLLPLAKDEYSWNTYKWNCAHCDMTFVDIMSLRIHLRNQHNLCFGFQCADCNEKTYNFVEFVDHIVTHRNNFRIYCQFCHKKFESQKSCFEHMQKAHVESKYCCELCGLPFCDNNSLKSHQKIYNNPLSKVIMGAQDHTSDNIPTDKDLTNTDLNSMLQSRGIQEESLDVESRSWSTYDWTCCMCLSKFKHVKQLRKHSQESHIKCFTMKCMDCDKVFRKFTMFVNHVIKHRSYLRFFCHYCNEYYPDNNKLASHVKNKHIKGYLKPCDGCGQIFNNINLLKKHMQKYGAPKKLETVTTEDLTCNVCLKLFSSVESVRKHQKVHEDRQRDFMCHTCGKSFFDKVNLKIHISTHNPQYETCKICNQQFKSKRQLRIHVSIHLGVRQFICHDCGKACRTKRQLKFHLLTHSNVLNFKCQFCDKAFRLKTGLNVHMAQHTGIRPYQCECCEMRFTNWANCNKHMIRRHGVTLAKTKRTSKGAVAISRDVGAPIKQLKCDENDLEWINNTMALNKPGRRKKVKTEKEDGVKQENQDTPK